MFPFGKYKGQQISEVFKRDKKYVDWLVTTEWFTTRFVDLCKISNHVISEHNRNIVYNDFIHNGKGSYPDDRLKKLNLNIMEQKKIGSYIILSEPSEVMKKIYDKPNWLNDTKKILQKYTDRPIIVHNKFSKKNLD